MRQDGVTKGGVRQSGDHRRLHDGKDFTRVRREHGETEYAVTVRIQEHLHESACLADGSGAQDRGHRDCGYAHRDLLLLRRGFVEPHASKLRIDERALGNQSIAGGPHLSREIVAHHSEVVERYVRELWATGALAHGPDSGGCGSCVPNSRTVT